MKKNIDGEKIALIIVVLIIIIALFFIIFAVFKSDFNFYSNENNNIENTTNNNTTASDDKKTNTNPTPDDVDDMNVDPTTVPTPAPVEEQIASFKTTIYDKEKGRIHNIGLAISKLNNTIIEKGQEFSFNNTIGAMGEKEGYEKALGFDTNGKKIQIFGGGMCQLSSTLYNAALISNLQITERHPHSRRVYYVPKDKDATIYYPDLDLKFINNTDGKIKIIATNTDSDVTIVLMKIK